jgi:hypothetical protein
MLLAAEKDGIRSSGHRRLHSGAWPVGAGIGGARAPGLISVHAAVGAGCGDMMIDGVSRQDAAARSFEASP